MPINFTKILSSAALLLNIFCFTQIHAENIERIDVVIRESETYSAKNASGKVFTSTYSIEKTFPNILPDFSNFNEDCDKVSRIDIYINDVPETDYATTGIDYEVINMITQEIYNTLKSAERKGINIDEKIVYHMSKSQIELLQSKSEYCKLFTLSNLVYITNKVPIENLHYQLDVPLKTCSIRETWLLTHVRLLHSQEMNSDDVGKTDIARNKF